MLTNCNNLDDLRELPTEIQSKLTQIGREQRSELTKYRLKGEDIIFRYTDLEIGAIWNGIGPDWFPAWLRHIVTWLRPYMSVASVIHDLEWWESDGSKRRFTESNDRLYENGCIIADALGWCNPNRYLVKGRALRFKHACQQFGWSAWLYSYEQRCKREHKKEQ